MAGEHVGRQRLALDCLHDCPDAVHGVGQRGVIDVDWLKRRGPDGIDGQLRRIPRQREIGSGRRINRAGVRAGAVVRELRGIPGRLAIGPVDEEREKLDGVALHKEETPSGLGRVVIDIGVFDGSGAEGSSQKQHGENQSS